MDYRKKPMKKCIESGSVDEPETLVSCRRGKGKKYTKKGLYNFQKPINKII